MSARTFDVHVLEALECGMQVGRRANVLGKEIVDLVKSQVALLPPELNETLKVFPFVLLLHAPKLSYQPASPPAVLANASQVCAGSKSFDLIKSVTGADVRIRR
jgi:hypothetical protein